MPLQLTEKLIKPMRNNYVERPWGGSRIRRFKRMCPLPDQRATAGAGLGEVFEIAAYDFDLEAARFPSQVQKSDGSRISLPALLESRAEELLGAEFTKIYGACFPLLPKYLDIEELLSVQGHPLGNTEAYIVVDAEPGATIRLGFNRDIDRQWLGGLLEDGREKQSNFLQLADAEADIPALQDVLKAWFAARTNSPDDGDIGVGEWITDTRDQAAALGLLSQLKAVYWSVLDLMNEVEVQAGQVIYNANPARVTAMTGKSATAEVHALGNPEGKEIVMLEIRRPGPTLRAWDNVRFPLRDIDIGGALDVLSLHRTDPAEFAVDRVPVPGREGVFVSVDSEYFRIEHLMPSGRSQVRVPAEQPHCLHAISGAARFENARGALIGELDAGESALVPIGVGAYTASAVGDSAEVVKVSLP